MFWAVTCESGKRYSQKPKEPFCITMAALEPRDKLPENKQVSLMLEHGGKEFLLCTLEYDRVMQVNMSLKFSEGEEPYFFVSGEGTIHLSGYINEQNSTEEKKIDDIYNQPSTSRIADEHEESELEDEDESDEDDDDDDDGRVKEDIGVNMLLTQLNDSDDDEDDADYNPAMDLPQTSMGKITKQSEVDDVVCLNSDEDSEDEEEDDDEEDDDDSDVSNEENDEGIAEAGTSKKRKKNLVTVSTKRVKHDGKKTQLVSLAAMRKSRSNDVAEENDESGSDDDDDVDEDMDSSIGRTPMPKKVMGILKNGSQSASKSFSCPSLKSSGLSNKGKQPLIKGVSEKSESYSHTLPSGVQYEDVRVGNGPMAKNGKFLHVYYVGKFRDGSVFDSAKEGKNKPFTLRLGKNEVIPGWDEGLLGMRVGGKRKLVIPPKMGYGNKKMPGIPPNSTLYFTVELKAVN